MHIIDKSQIFFSFKFDNFNNLLFYSMPPCNFSKILSLPHNFPLDLLKYTYAHYIIGLNKIKVKKGMYINRIYIFYVK